MSNTTTTTKATTMKLSKNRQDMIDTLNNMTDAEWDDYRAMLKSRLAIAKLTKKKALPIGDYTRDDLGVILHETKDLVVIATWNSNNRKTGKMVQIWILVRTMSPVTASNEGLDSIVCGNCPHRQSLGGGCYVNLGQAPRSIWDAYNRGQYTRTWSADMFAGKSVRFGAYGDPAFIPYTIVADIVKVAKNHTGYTHQWNNDIDPRFAKFFMASVDSKAEYTSAKASGWRTFRVTSELEMDSNEMECLSDAKDIECKTCGLCNGNKAGKDIAILGHGSRKSSLKVS